MSEPARAVGAGTAAQELLERLKSHRILAEVPAEELAWVAAHGVLRRFEQGAALTRRDQLVERLLFVLSGHLAIFVDHGDGPHKVSGWHAGDVTGLLPYSRLKYPPGETMAVEESEGFEIGKEHLDELIRSCPQLTTRMVHVMLDRARLFTSSEVHDEKMKSLGKLAAGLAHELNNPASAVVRSAKLLQDGLAAADTASRALGAEPLTPAQRDALDAVRSACLAARAPGALSPLEASDRVDAITGWLEDHGADPSIAGPLADTAVTLPALDGLSAALEGRALDLALQWVAHGCSTRALAREIETSASRIYELVSAVKGFTHLDQETSARPVDVARDLETTLTMLRSKVKTRSAFVSITAAPGLPPVPAYGGELNQVWMNLLDNALDAIPDGGRVDVGASAAAGNVVVTVADNGPGIPQAVLSRIFDPFFTTKPVGKGTGLGLDIVRRLLARHNATIDVESRPGRTVFKVTLPAAGGGAARAV